MGDGRRLVGLAAAFSLAASLVGLTWGLPARWHPDEKADDAAALVAARSLIPASFINPSLPLYLMMPAIAVQQGLARAGVIGERLADPLLAGRVLSAVAGALAVWLLGRGAGGAAPALAAWLLALAPGFVNLCHFATPEPWLLLATVGVLVGCRRHLDGRLGALGLGVLVGLAGATKYTAAALLLPALLAAAQGADARRRPLRPAVVMATGAVTVVVGLWIAATLPLAARLHLPDARLLHPETARGFVRGIGLALATAGAGAAALATIARAGRPWARRAVALPLAQVLLGSALGFCVGTPGALVRPLRFLSDLAFNQQTRSEYKGLTGDATSFVPYLSLLVDALTVPLLVLAACGLFVALARAVKGHALSWVWIAAALAPYLLVASSGHRALRFLAPLFPVAALLAAEAVSGLLRPASTRALVTGAVIARLVAGVVLVDRLFLVDARRQAARWIEAHVPAGTAVDVITNHPGYAPEPAGYALRVVPTLSREMAPPARFEQAAREYPQTASPWLVLTAAYYQRFLEHPGQEPERARFFQELLDGRGGFTVVARFKQQGWRRPPVEFVDPEIVILRRE